MNFKKKCLSTVESVSYGCETWSPILIHGQRLTGYENRIQMEKLDVGGKEKFT
jgi:hypothetical protein